MQYAGIIVRVRTTRCKLQTRSFFHKWHLSNIMLADNLFNCYASKSLVQNLILKVQIQCYVSINFNFDIQY